MLRLWYRKTKTVTVTRNLVLELKYDTVNKMIMPCPVGEATEIFTCPTKLPVLIVIPCFVKTDVYITFCTAVMTPPKLCLVPRSTIYGGGVFLTSETNFKG